MKIVFGRHALLLTLTLLLVLLSICALSACGGSEVSETVQTTEKADRGFAVVGNDDVRVETARDGSVIYLYVDQENAEIDLTLLADATQCFTLTDTQGTLVADNVIKASKSGDTFTVFYGDDKLPYRITVYFNVYYNVSFETVDTPIRVLEGATVTPPDSVIEKIGYDFQGWNFDFNTPITADITISAKWKARTYSVTLDPKGGVLSSLSMRVTYGESVSLPVPTLEGYVFTGWLDGESPVTSGIWTIARDVTLSAVWEHYDYKITYDPNGGEVDKLLQGVSYGEAFTTPVPKRAGYTFLGWYCDGIAVNTAAYAYREDKTFLAMWEENRYVFTFETNGGSFIESGEYTYLEMTSIAPSRDGYTFGGWFFDRDMTETDADVSEGNAVTVYAWWLEEDKPSSYRYEITDRGVVILGYTSYGSAAVIPSYIGGIKVVEIGFEAFKDVTYLETVTYPDSVTRIGAYAFSGASGLVSLNSSKDGIESIDLSGITEIDAYAFEGCSFTRIILSNAVTLLNEGVFKDCKRLETISLGAIDYLGAYVFSGCESLGSLVLSGDFETIGAYAFEGCVSLSSVTLLSNYTEIGEGAFSSCVSLTALTVPQSLRVIADRAFADCMSLETLAGYQSLYQIQSIGAYAFSGCVALEYFDIPISVVSLGVYAFEDCRKLSAITLPAAVTAIPEGLFKGCTSLAAVTLKAKLTAIGDYAFQSCRALSTLSLTDSLKTIGAHAFENCILISNLAFSESVSDIGAHAFRGCVRLSEVTLGKNITVINDGVFDGCIGLSELNWHNAITAIGARAFADCQLLEITYIPSECLVIGDEAFIGCRSIQSLSVDRALTSIGSRAFTDCVSLTKIIYSGTTERWNGVAASDALYGCTSLKSIETVTWSYDDLRESLVRYSATGAYWGYASTLAFNGNRPAAVLSFAKNNVFYKNLVTLLDENAVLNDRYRWTLSVKGETETAGIVSSFETVVTVTLSEIIDFGGFGFVILDLGDGIAAQSGIFSLELTLNIYSASDLTKLLYSSELSKVTLTAPPSEVIPDSERTDQAEVSVSMQKTEVEAWFDRNTATSHFAMPDDDIVLQFDDAFVLSSYSFVTMPEHSAYSDVFPASWKVYGGTRLEDGRVEWVLLSSVTEHSEGDDWTEYHFTLENNLAFSQYRIEFDSNYIVALSEIVLYRK